MTRRAAYGRLARKAWGRQSGLVLIAFLLMLMLVAVGALSAGETWATTRKREREAQLLWVGEQYRKAIESYWRATPGPRKVLPSSIDQLLNDDRFPNPVHHLRKAYADPLDESQDLEPIKVNNALVGVHSKSEETPMKIANFSRRNVTFEDAADYAHWNFVFVPPQRVAGPPVLPGPNGMAPTVGLGLPGTTSSHR
jgi:type II secretory pathway pseudopilin PulG